jgi:hypothetical protein
MIVAVRFMPRRDKRLASIGQLLLALVSYELLGRILFSLVSPWVLSAETVAVHALLSTFGVFTRDNLTIISADGHSISIEVPCSAFHNLTLAALVWISLLKFETLEINRSHLLTLGMMAGVTLVLNTGRIALMAQSYEMYEYWHVGRGMTIVSLAMLSALLGTYLGMRRLTVPA